MARRGLRAHVDAVGNAVGEVGTEGPLVVLLGHMDTAPGRVPVRRAGDRLYGRGAVDAKGPLAAFICAAARLADSGCADRLGLRLVMVGAVEEESATSRGARHVAVTYRPDACVIGEPSRWDRVTLGYKGRLLVEYALDQDAAHTAGAGATAAERSVAFWNGIVALAGAANGAARREFERLSPTLRRIEAASDGLCDRAQLEVSLRLPPGCDMYALEAQIQSLAGAATVRFGGEEPAYLAPKNTPLVRAFLGAIRAQEAAPAFVLKTGTSDMNVVGPHWGCPILAYGPGDAALDHTPDEHICLAEYGRSIAVLTRALGGMA
jgi:LysW-gamma-L-lysine carboxypeptidase